MGYRFKDWQKTLADFQNSVEKSLAEVRAQKEEVLRMKAELQEEYNNGKFIRDERRIVLSAPEIVIGNIDKNGNLLADGSVVVIRSHSVDIDGVGDEGVVKVQAPHILQMGIDTGADGLEAVVPPVSEVITQARSITIQANDVTDTFVRQAAPAAEGCINIHADSNIDIDATKAAETLKKELDSRISALKSQKSEYDKMAKSEKTRVDNVCQTLEKLMKDADKARGDGDDDDMLRGHYIDLEDLNAQIRVLTPELTNAIESYSRSISLLAETNRQIKSLENVKGKIKTGDDFKKKTTNTSVSVSSESVYITSTDGDGNLRDNKEAIVMVTSNRTKIGAVEHDGSLKEKGELQVNAKTVGVSTATTKMKDAKNGDMTAVGDIILTSKTITMEAVDSEIKDEKPQEKALTKDGKLSIRVEKTLVSATDTEGKATGSIQVNGKLVEVKSMDVDKEKRTDKELAKDSKMLLVSEKMYLGARDKQVKSKKVQAVSEEMGLFADKTLEAQQGEKKAVLQLADGKAALSGSETQVYGKTTINDKTEVKGELKAPKATIDNVEAKSAFKSPNISDGMAAGGAGGGGSLSAKLTVEDGPKES